MFVGFDLKLNWQPLAQCEYKIRGGTVRITKESNINAIDLVTAVCNKDRNDAGQTLRRLIASEKLSSTDLTYISVGTKKKICMVSFTNAIKLMMLLPGNFAQVNRQKFAQILHQYYAGSAELKAQIDRNAASHDLLHILAREALATDRAAEPAHAAKDAGEVESRRYGPCRLPRSALSPSLPGRCSNCRRWHPGHQRCCNIRSPSPPAPSALVPSPQDQTT